MRYIEDIKDGDSVIGHYFCKTKQLMKSRAGKVYLSLVLTDKTGFLDAKVWDLNNQIHEFEQGEFIKVDGFASTFNGDLQLKVTKIRRSLPGEYHQSDYVPTTKGDIEAMYLEITYAVESVQNPYLKALLVNIFSDQEILAKFKTSTAAKVMHHSYAGGLLEHTLAVVQICDFLCKQYRDVFNRDLLITSAILHDIGKIWELVDFPENEYTDIGQLLGHVYMGAELVEKESAKIQGFPPSLAAVLKHCILSHHGEYEFGSPKLPSVVEAFVLHYCDNIDAKLFSFMDIIERDQSKGNWTGYNKMFGRYLRKTSE